MNMADNKGDRAVRDRAYKLAESGSFANVRAVEQALIGEGWPNVGTAIGNDYTRKAIQDRLPEQSH
jgi:hypothetical protein